MTLLSRPGHVNRRRSLLRASLAGSTAALVGPVLANQAFRRAPSAWSCRSPPAVLPT